jgi:hypothetical protein
VVYRQIGKSLFFTDKHITTCFNPPSFLFFGLFNIARYAVPCGKDKDYDLYQQMKIITGKIDPFRHDMHHFANPENFSIENGKIKILDYGNKETQTILTLWGEKIYNEFKPD